MLSAHSCVIFPFLHDFPFLLLSKSSHILPMQTAPCSTFLLRVAAFSLEKILVTETNPCFPSSKKRADRHLLKLDLCKCCGVSSSERALEADSLWALPMRGSFFHFLVPSITEQPLATLAQCCRLPRKGRDSSCFSSCCYHHHHTSTKRGRKPGSQSRPQTAVGRSSEHFSSANSFLAMPALLPAALRAWGQPSPDGSLC